MEGTCRSRRDRPRVEKPGEKLSDAGSSLATAPPNKGVDVLGAHPLDFERPLRHPCPIRPKPAGRRSRTFRPNGLIPGCAASADAVIRSPGN